MTIEQLRSVILTGLDGIGNLPWIVRRNITDAQMRVIRGMRSYWQQATENELVALNQYVEREPVRSAEHPVCPTNDVPEPFSTWQGKDGLVFVTEVSVWAGPEDIRKGIPLVAYAKANMSDDTIHCTTVDHFKQHFDQISVSAEDK